MGRQREPSRATLTGLKGGAVAAVSSKTTSSKISAWDRPAGAGTGLRRFVPLRRGGTGPLRNLSFAKEAHIDDFDGLCRSDKSRALSRGSHGKCKNCRI